MLSVRNVISFPSGTDSVRIERLGHSIIPIVISAGVCRNGFLRVSLTIVHTGRIIKPDPSTNFSVHEQMDKVAANNVNDFSNAYGIVRIVSSKYLSKVIGRPSSCYLCICFVPSRNCSLLLAANYSNQLFEAFRLFVAFLQGFKGFP